VTFPSISVIVEWDTGAECGGGRARRCVEELSRQFWAARERFVEPPELIVVHDSADPPAEAIAGLGWPGRLETIPAPTGVDYYSKKNLGFAHSRGAVVAFVDSDLAPELGWLEAIVAPFDDVTKNVVVGRTHFELTSHYARAMALFWIFDTRIAETLLRPTRRLVSNNIAFRRPLFAAMPFPTRNIYRGQCSELGAALAQRLITLWEATDARAAHPAPAGLAAFAARAIQSGRGAFRYRAIEGSVGYRDAWDEWRRDRGSVRRRIAERSEQIGATPFDRLAAHVLGSIFYGIKCAAFMTALTAATWTKPAPRHTGTRWQQESNAQPR